MPLEQKKQYNPIIVGFSGEDGPLSISLKNAQERFGRLPSSYGLVPPKEGRERKKGLNLEAGKFIRDVLKHGDKNLKGAVIQYFKGWHRDLSSEFGINIDPFLNINDPHRVLEVIRQNRPLIKKILRMDLKASLLEKGLILKDVLNSIKEENLAEAVYRILTKKIRQFTRDTKKREAQEILDCLHARELLNRLETLVHGSLLEPENTRLSSYADEAAKLFLGMPERIGFTGTETLLGITGAGIEFEFATRDISYLKLGKDTGDCTSDKKNFQADTGIENIFWTVFSWILDRNYQILKVYYHGEFVMKVHLLPLYITDMASPVPWNSACTPGRSDYMILAVDAVETIRGFRDDIPGYGREDLLSVKDEVFGKTLEKIAEIAGRMGIDHIYGEKFSNTRWVREYYDTFPEIFLHVNHIEKIDQLEDIFYLARSICRGSGYDLPDDLFMEIQMKNTYLSPKIINKAPGVKSFSVIKGNPSNGIPMNRVIGI